MRRRSFLAAAGAATFGAFPGGTAAVQLPDRVRARRVLEVFLPQRAVGLAGCEAVSTMAIERMAAA